MASSSSIPLSSSSSVPPPRGRTYDVFLSFRGEDTRNGFVDHLYTALDQRGIYVFKDDEELRIGQSISPELLKAIEDSRFAVVVFSKNYANSSWCLEELAKIMECKDQKELTVLPVFYHIDPSDVRGQKRDFATAFEKHEEKFRREMEKVNKWRKALAATASLSGRHVSETVREGESVTSIVEEILRSLKPLGMEKNLIGLQSRIDELISLLGMEATKEVRTIGILGMGGIGKTTTARALFRRISHKFDGSSFVSNVRENSKTNIRVLQEKILQDILLTKHEFKFSDPEDGAEMIQERLNNKKVLLVLDDVDNTKQLEFLAATREWFGPGSRIIITTRDEHVISHANAKYQPALLLLDQAVELFSRHAFQENRPPDGYKELSNRAMCYTGCLPLAVKVLGSFFHGRRADVWEDALDRLSKSPNDEIFNTLKLSFDGLQHSDKKIFLDIVCFFLHKSVEYVIRIHDCCDFQPRFGIDVLIQKSLITISKKRIKMHDLIQEMGLQIVRESFPNSRPRQLEEIRDLITKNRNLEAIEVIRAPRYYIHNKERGGFTADVFERMQNLRILDVNKKFTSCEPSVLPRELRWLCWEDYPFSSLPVSYMRKLVSLQMVGGNIEHILWNGQKIMENLKFINLGHSKSLTWFPDVSWAPNIEELDLSFCEKLVEVHESLGLLQKLVCLDMRHCYSLKRLPSRIAMSSLETLYFSNCMNLETFPEVSPCMVKLSRIRLDGCVKIDELPSSMNYLSSLSSLNLRSCRNMEKLEELPQPELLKFHALPNLCCLTELDLSGNFELMQLPANISHLSSLKKLYLNECHGLRILHGLPSGIQILMANDCWSLEKIEDLSEKHQRLDKIGLAGCYKLLEDEESEIYIDEMLKQSFLMKYAAADRCLSICIPGNKIPSRFKEQKDGYLIPLPPNWQTRVIGFAICAAFPGPEESFLSGIIRSHAFMVSDIRFRFANEEMPVPLVRDSLVG